jgi:hypothetical protein
MNTTTTIPKITSLADRLIQQSEARKAALERKTEPIVNEPVRVKLCVMLIDDPRKENCAWGWVKPDSDKESVLCGATLNLAFSPVMEAVETACFPFIRWLASLCICERLALARWIHPNVERARRSLWTLLELEPKDTWDAMGAGWRLSRHGLTEPMERMDLRAEGRQLIASFIGRS